MKQLSSRESRVENSETLTVEPFVSGHEGAPQLVTGFVRQILKVLFAPLAELVLHLLGATRVSLRTHSKVLTCKTQRTQRALHAASALSLTLDDTICFRTGIFPCTLKH